VYISNKSRAHVKKDTVLNIDLREVNSGGFNVLHVTDWFELSGCSLVSYVTE
jgi:hypothetical protein